MIIKNISIVLIISVSTLTSGTLSYINNIRANSGCGALKWSKELAYAAKKHAIYLATNSKFGHTESSYNKNFYASTPWQRIVKAGYSTRAVVENITFYEPNYRYSIKKIMGTVYHRLALLDTKVDTIGFANYRKVYVYDMSNSKVANLCKRSKNSGLVNNICKKTSKTLRKTDFYSALSSTKRRSRDIIKYPYSNQKNVGVKLERETPSFLPTNRSYGFAVTVTLNSAYYTKIRLKKFKLYLGKREVKSKSVTFRNDRRKKLDKNSFVLIPTKKLLHKREYRVVFEAIADGKAKRISWVFSTN